MPNKFASITAKIVCFEVWTVAKVKEMWLVHFVQYFLEDYRNISEIKIGFLQGLTFGFLQVAQFVLEGLSD